MAYELGGVKKRPWWELLLASFGGGVGLGTQGAPSILGGEPAALPKPAPATAPAKTPGLFTEGDVTYGEEDIGQPREEWTPLTPEEVARRRKAFGGENLMSPRAMPMTPKKMVWSDTRPNRRRILMGEVGRTLLEG